MKTMNREIKFRAFNKQTHKMTYWDEIQSRRNLHKLMSLSFVVLMRYTGLKDKNGVEIYEWDMVSDHVGFGYIEYHHAGFRVNYNNGSCKWLSDYLKKEFETIEVIGNIHEKGGSR